MASSSCPATSAITGPTSSPTTSSIKSSTSCWARSSFDRGESVLMETGSGASSSFSFFFASTSQSWNSRRVLSMRTAITAHTTRQRPLKPMRLPRAVEMAGDDSSSSSSSLIEAV